MEYAGHGVFLGGGDWHISRNSFLGSDLWHTMMVSYWLAPMTHMIAKQGG
jgi:hypothetical protein